MKVLAAKPIFIIGIALALALTLAVLPALAAPVEEDVGAGAEDSYLYGGTANEVSIFTSTGKSLWMPAPTLPTVSCARSVSYTHLTLPTICSV